MKGGLPGFSGTAAEMGAARRQVWGTAWEEFQAARRRSGERVDAGRVSDFRDLLRQVAPEWLEEAEAFAGDGVEAYLDFQCREPEPDPESPEGSNCSTLLSVGTPHPESGAGRTWLLKIRDEAPNPQIMWWQELAGRHPVLAGSNLGNLGIAQAVNGAGLAAANNTGGPLTDRRTDVALNDCLVMRLIAERCANCGEAGDLLRRLCAQGALGNGGYARGMIFILADASGEGVVAECSRQQVRLKKVTEGMEIRTNHGCLPGSETETDRARFGEPAMKSSFARFERMQALAARAQPLDREALERISRDQEGEFPLCQIDSPFPWRTVSSWIHEITPGEPSVTTFACNVAPTLVRYARVEWLPTREAVR